MKILLHNRYRTRFLCFVSMSTSRRWPKAKSKLNDGARRLEVANIVNIVEQNECRGKCCTHKVAFKEKGRKYRVHFLLKRNRTKRMFAMLLNDISKHENKFFSFTRMSIKSFDEMLSVIKLSIRNVAVNMR